MPELEFECDTIFTLRNQFPTTFVLGVLTEMSKKNSSNFGSMEQWINGTLDPGIWNQA